MSNKISQKGTFSIELSFVLLAMAVLLFFIFDLGFQVIQKSQLNRTSYSLVSVLKERKAFYSPNSRDTNWTINQSQADQMLQMAKKLQGNNADIRVSIGFKSGSQAEVSLSAGDNSLTCDSRPIPNTMTQGSKRDLNVYRVTICKKVPAFYEAAFLSNKNRVLSSTSVFVGR
ncbi:tight adherence pilus pseudopilin TadF [Photobacterium sanguinicancri]|uniref:tight adherence pilus pseudopilin TadF n=1 Tax=Photobacterium sanguinicancri TaxID=875932 RepID=UPI0021C2EE54|nr:tight adherence pilus pseudopilin TadF [Photobacterium sanguinicancri]MDO6498439.1 tight adherence pilus pseudopilin TadF [Photobacterium sanguinicancri]